MIINDFLVTKILEEANKCYGDDSPAEDPMNGYKYSPREVRAAVNHCRAHGLLVTTSRFGRQVESVGIDRWWTGGLSMAGMDELKNRKKKVERFNDEMISQRDKRLTTWYIRR